MQKTWQRGYSPHQRTPCSWGSSEGTLKRNITALLFTHKNTETRCPGLHSTENEGFRKLCWKLKVLGNLSLEICIFPQSQNTLVSEVHLEASCLEFKARLPVEIMFQMVVRSLYLLLKVNLHKIWW